MTANMIVSANQDLPRWKCLSCKQRVHPEISWGMDGSKKVDILDCCCPNCGSIELEFQGTKGMENAWWDKEWAK